MVMRNCQQAVRIELNRLASDLNVAQIMHDKQTRVASAMISFWDQA